MTTEYKGHRLVEKRIVNIEKRLWEWDDFVYIEVWHNNHIKDSYFCVAGEVYPNGDARPNAIKYFYSAQSGCDIRRQMDSVKRPSKFTHFDKLYYINAQDGEIYRIDGKPAVECDYVQDALDLIAEHEEKEKLLDTFLFARKLGAWRLN